jgi:lipopolysaccharide transport system ATP-binding protein
MSSEIAIRVQELSKHYQIYDHPRDRLLQMLWRGKKQFYRDFHALENISFDVAKGETVGIVGRNGAGKSTLLQLICGTLTPSSGEVRVNGRVAALLELGTGFNSEYSGRDNVMINAAILGLSSEETAACYEDIVAFADIGDFINQPVKTYSSGMYVRLAFSVAIHVRPDILIVDEALSVGDAFFQAKCMTRMRQMIADGATLLFISHDIGAVKAICQRVIWLEHGRVRQQGPTNEVANMYALDWVSQVNLQRNQLSPRSQPKQESHNTNAVSATDNLIPPLTRWSARSGAGHASITALGVSIAGKLGDQVTVHYGQIVQLAAEVHVRQACRNLVLSYHIKDKNNQHVQGCHTADRERLFNREWLPGQRVQVVFKLPVYLHHGNYSLTILLSSMEDIAQYTDAVFFDWIEDVASLRVLPREHFPLSDLLEIENDIEIHTLPDPEAGKVAGYSG